MKLMTFIKTCTLIALATLSFNALAGSIYVGNPTRPYTIWIPGHYVHGCWKEGYYVKYLNPPVCCKNVTWVEGHCDGCGHYIPAHFEPRNVVVVGVVKS